MRTGASISGLMHGGAIALALFGLPVFDDGPEEPMDLVEITLIPGAEFDIQSSVAPTPPNTEVADLADPATLSGAAALAAPPGEIDQPNVREEATPQSAPEPVARPSEPASQPDQPIAASPATPMAEPTPGVEAPTETVEMTAPAVEIPAAPDPHSLALDDASPEITPQLTPDLNPRLATPAAASPQPSPETTPLQTPQPDDAPQPVEMAEALQVTAPTPDAPPTANVDEPDPEPQEEVKVAAAPRKAPTPQRRPQKEVADTPPSPDPTPSGGEPTETAIDLDDEKDPAERILSAVEPAGEKKPPSAVKPGGDDLASFLEKTLNVPGVDKTTTPTKPQVIGPPLSDKEKSAFLSRLRKCWRVPLGIRDARDLNVTLSFQLSRDGKLLTNPKLIKPRSIAGRTNYRTAFESARRAINGCAPYKLPAAKYKHWKSWEITFNPARYALR